MWNSNCLAHEYWEYAAGFQALIIKVVDLGISSAGYTMEVLRMIQGAFLRLYRRARNRGYTAVAEIYEVYAYNMLARVREEDMASGSGSGPLPFPVEATREAIVVESAGS